MLPPVLEIYALWHAKDFEGAAIADEFISHFRGTAFTGLIGGAVEVFARSAGWLAPDGPPRPIPTPSSPPPNGVRQSQFTVIVPILGTELTRSVESSDPWRQYLEDLRAAQEAHPEQVLIAPYRLDGSADPHTKLRKIVGSYQTIAATKPEADHDTKQAMRTRDLSQAIAQFVTTLATQRLTVFISHTKHSGSKEAGDVGALVADVRNVIASTHLQAFFDASDLQPGADWSAELIANASHSALLAIRTDLYPTREWCQREMLLAKQHGMPVVILDGIGFAEERGSFLMDHVPRTPVRHDAREWRRADIYRAIDLLVDECLKRELWRWQKKLATAQPTIDVSWWAPHAPEPVTLLQWLQTNPAGYGPAKTLTVLHPDPPLGVDELLVLRDMLKIGGLSKDLDVMTPRQLAARGG